MSPLEKLEVCIWGQSLASMIVWEIHWERESGAKQRRQLHLSPHLQPNDKGRSYKGAKMLKRGSERQGIVSS